MSNVLMYACNIPKYTYTMCYHLYVCPIVRIQLNNFREIESERSTSYKSPARFWKCQQSLIESRSSKNSGSSTPPDRRNIYSKMTSTSKIFLVLSSVMALASALGGKVSVQSNLFMTIY